MNERPVEDLVREPRSKTERYTQILAVLADHGIGAFEAHVVEGGDKQWQPRAHHLRLACEKLGTVFIKLGQMLSTRGDILPDPYRVELAKLQDDVPPLPTSVIAEAIREELGASPEELFASFVSKPMGSASIGQVHAAELFDGRRVVVKVRKPGVEALVHLDLQILADVVRTWSPRFPVLEQFDASGLVREFSDTLTAELDYRREAVNEKLFRAAFSKRTGFVIPEVVDQYSGERVVTLTRIEGLKIGEVADMPKRRRALVAQRIARFVLEPAFERGVFYADPHPGNLLIHKDGSVGVFDFGMVGRLPPESRRVVADMFIAIGRCDAQRLTDRLIEITAPTHPVDRAALTVEVGRLLDQYVAVSLENLQLGKALQELVGLLREHCMRLPANVADFLKAFVMAEGMLRTVDPDSNLTDYLEPLAGKLVYEDVTGGGHLGDRVRNTVLDAAQLTFELPGRIDRVLGEVERGNLRVWTRLEDADVLVRRLEHMVERLSVTMLAAASIIGLAVIMQFYHPQGWERWIGAVFWTAVAAIGAVAIWTIVAMRK